MWGRGVGDGAEDWGKKGLKFQVQALAGRSLPRPILASSSAGASGRFPACCAPTCCSKLVVGTMCSQRIMCT